MSEKNYVDILIESLKKKSAVLDKLLQKNDEQSILLDGQEFDMDAFDSVMDEKAKLIVDLRFLDSGFTAIYDKAKDILKEQKIAYAVKIREMKELITEITEKSTAVETSERRNDMKFKNRFRKEQQKVGQSRNTMRATNGYYRSMTGAGTGSPDARFMDTKF